MSPKKEARAELTSGVLTFILLMSQVVKNSMTLGALVLE